MAEPLGDSHSHAHLRRPCAPATSAPKPCCSGWVHRIRDLGGVLFIDLRDRAGVSQSSSATNRRADGGGRSGCGPSIVIGVDGHRAAAVGETRSTRSCATGEVEVLARDDPDPERGEDAAVSDRRGLAGVRKKCGCVSLPRSAARRGCSTNIGLRHRVAMHRVRKYFDANGFWEIETPILTKSTPGGRARLPGAEPRAPGRVLRAAAVAADLQADPDDRGHRPLLPDRAAASATRTCAPTGSPSSRSSTSRCRSRGRTIVFGLIEPLMQRDLQGDRPRRVAPPFRRMPYAEAMAMYGSDKPDLRCGLEIARPVRRVPRLGVPRVQADRRGGRRRPRVRGARAATGTRAASSTSSSIRRSRWASAA